MSKVICTMGLFVVSIFGIVMYGPMGVDPAGGTNWVECIAFGIIGVSVLPPVREFIAMSVEAFRRWIDRR